MCHPALQAGHHGRRPRARWLSAIAAAVLLALLLLSSSAEAASDPDLQWWTLETAHFRIHYERELEPMARRIARLSEAIHTRLVDPLGYAPDRRTEVVLTDVTDAANGSATAVPYNLVRLFITAPSDISALGDADDYFLQLMTHEYTHILHVDNVSGLPSLVNAILGKTLTPNQLQPRWILEGLATVMESAYTSAGRVRASQFDMMLRTDFIEDNIASLDQLSSGPRRWPGGSLYYLYGSRFVQWIVDVYGADVMRAVSIDYGASLMPWGINRAIKRQTGRTYIELYEGFKEHQRRVYKRQMKGVRRRGLREGRRLTYHGRQVQYPRFVPADARAEGSRYQLAYYRSDGSHREGIYRIDIGAGDGKGPLPEELWARVAGSGPVAFTPEGDLMVSSVVPFKRIYRRPDLFSISRGERAPDGGESHRKRLTVGRRAIAPTVSADGRLVAFTRNHQGTTTLMIADRDGLGALSNLRPLIRSRRYDQVFTPRFSPDGKSIAYGTWRKGGYRDVHIIDVATRKVKPVTHDRALEVQPTWSPTGDKLLFSSDRTGIFNIYAYDVGSAKLQQVTNVRTGAFMPAVSEDGKLLVYVGYTKAGYDLYAMRLDSSRFLEALPAPNIRPDPYGEPPPVPIKKYRYNPLPTLRPHSYSFEYAPGNFGDNALTIIASGGDAVGHHGFGVSLIADPSAPAPMVSLNYSYLRLPFDMSMRLSNRVTKRADYRISDQKPEYIEHAYSLQSSLSYAHLGEFGSQRMSMSYSASLLDSELPVGEVGTLDPYASVTVEPLSGLLSTVSASYVFSNVEGSFYTAGAARGMTLRLGLDYGDERIGSEDSIYAAKYEANAYLSMPWRGHHTLALRSGGGISTGTFARRGVFFVGGYNLENTSLIDSVTSGILNGAFVMRGYEPGTYRGTRYILNSFEYRIPVAEVDRGISTVPIYLQRIDANLFFDHGGAWNNLDLDGVEFFSDGAIISSPAFHTGVGAELWTTMTFGYGMTALMRLGYAYGFSVNAVPGGQGYFIAASAF